MQPGAVVTGRLKMQCRNPAQPIRRRFSPDVITRLEAIAWWTWPVEKITANLARITAADVDSLEALRDPS